MEKLVPWFIASVTNEKSGLENGKGKNVNSLFTTSFWKPYFLYADVIFCAFDHIIANHRL